MAEQGWNHQATNVLKWLDHAFCLQINHTDFASIKYVLAVLVDFVCQWSSSSLVRWNKELIWSGKGCTTLWLDNTLRICHQCIFFMDSPVVMWFWLPFFCNQTWRAKVSRHWVRWFSQQTKPPVIFREVPISMFDFSGGHLFAHGFGKGWFDEADSQLSATSL